MSGIQGLPLEVTVVACYNLDDKEWISRQDPYVCVEYGSTKFRTKTCRDGGKNPTFQEKFTFTLIEGLREVNVMVWDSNTLTADEFIGSGRIQLHKALSQGFDDNSWSLQGSNGRHSGEVRVILHYSTPAGAGAGAGKQSGKNKMAPPPGGPMTHNMPYASFPSAPMAPYSVPSPYNAYAPPTPSYSAPSPYYPQTYPPVSAYPAPPPVGYPPHQYPPPPSSYYPPGPPAGLYPPSPY